tara:strand:- start:248 stop:1084 length:837 start_codon:yes stop_codon:yes gene_type:complete
MKIIFIADFFVEDVLGGGELNNHELINMLISDGRSVKKIHSHMVTENFIEENRNSKFIVANFINLSQKCIEALYNKDYIIYEHDHKYLITRNPGDFKDFLAPKEAIINSIFYVKAAAVLCQSKFHLDIVNKNLNIDNLINLSGNIWSERSLNVMLKQNDLPKLETCAIINSSIEHKNTREAVMYCQYKKIPFKLINSENYEEFLRLMGENKAFVFFPKTPETLSRTVVEARMMGMGVIVNKMIGATGEPWYEKKGPELINIIRNKRTEIKEKVLEAIG